jgi:hypothetical protein
MVQLLRSDGKIVEIPDENKDKALATGSFTEMPAEPIDPSAKFIDHSAQNTLLEKHARPETIPENPAPLAAGQTEAGNVDLTNRPQVKNKDGSISTVRSMSFNQDGKEILVPTVSDDGRIMSDNEAIKQYDKTGKHLGKFTDPDSATAYAEQLHKDQEKLYGTSKFEDHSAQNVPLPKHQLTAEQQHQQDLSDDVDQDIALSGANDHPIDKAPLKEVPPTALIRSDGKLVDIPEENIDKALATGQFLKPTAEQYQDAYDKRRGEDELNDVGPVGAFATAALRRSPIRADLGSKHHDLERVEDAQTDIIQSNNPISYGAGAVTGEIGKAVQLGGLASSTTEALGLSGAPVLSAAGLTRSAISGGVYSMEPVVHAVINKDPAGAAEALAMGVGMDYGIHGIFSAVEGTIGKIPSLINKGSEPIVNKINEIRNPEVTPEQAANKIGKEIFGLPPQKLADFKQEIAPAMKAAKITVDDIMNDKAIEKMQQLEESGPAIGKAIKALDELLPSEKQPIIQKHLDLARKDIEELFPEEIQQQKLVAAKLSALNKRLNDPAMLEALEQHEKKMLEFEEYNAGTLEKPQELKDWEGKVSKEPSSAPKAAHVLDADEEEMANDFPGYESPSDRPTTPPTSEAKDLQAATARPESEAVKAYDAQQAERAGSPKSKPMFIKGRPYQEAIDAHGAMGQEFEQLLNQFDSIQLPPSAIEAKATLNPILAEMKAAGKLGKFSRNQALKKWVGDRANWNSAENGAVNGLKKQAYHRLAKNLMGAEDEAAELAGLGPEINEGLQQQRAAYSFNKMFGKYADRMAAKDMPESSLQNFIGVHSHNRRVLPVMLLHLLGLPSPVVAGAGFAMPFAKQYLEKQILKKSAQVLLGESMTPETNTVLHALQLRDVKIKDGVKDLVSALGSTQAARAITDHRGVQAFIPNSGVGQTGDRQFDTLRKAVAANESNPQGYADHLGNITSGLHNEGLPQVATAYNAHQLRLMKVIQTILPVDPAMKSAHPFSAKVAGDEISPATKEKYQRALSIAADPINLLHMIKSNTITAGDVAIAAATNPSTLQKMREELVEEAMKSKPNLSYQNRLSMEILMGEKLDQSTEQLPVLQAPYAAGGAKKVKPTKQKKSPIISAKSADNIQDSYLNVSEKAMGLGK